MQRCNMFINKHNLSDSGLLFWGNKVIKDAALEAEDMQTSLHVQHVLLYHSYLQGLKRKSM